MAKKTIADIDPQGKVVLMRVDFNVPRHQAETSPMIVGYEWRYRPSSR